MAMQRARARGCAAYDLGGFGTGLGDSENHTPVRRVNYFKSGFGGREVDFVAAHERIQRPAAFRLTRPLKRILT